MSSFMEWNDEIQQPGVFELMPAGDYAVYMRKAEEKDTKAGDGKYVAAEFEVIGLASGEPKYANRRLWHNFNTKNPKKQTQDIGNGQLTALSLGCGFTKERKPQSLEELCGPPVKIHVGVRYSDYKKADENYIKTFYKPMTATTAIPEPEGVAEYSGTKPSFSAGK